MLERINAPATCCNARWEAAYLAFETPEQEIRKFMRRLQRAGVGGWPRDARIVELCCGRGNGIVALSRLGFKNIEGLDLSESLLAHYDGPAKCYLCDCRRLPFGDASRDAVIVQGGLHHLAGLPDDVDQTISQVARVLCDRGTFVVVEPWLTPFLALAHIACRSVVIRGLSRKIDTLAAMNDQERETYERWLGAPVIILDLLSMRFEVVRREIRLGKLLFVGKKRAGGRNEQRG